MDAQLRLIPRPERPPADDGQGPARGPAARRVGERTAVRPSTERSTEAPAQWRIDESARERGRAGISRAREALRNARRPHPGDHHSTAA